MFRILRAIIFLISEDDLSNSLPSNIILDLPVACPKSMDQSTSTVRNKEIFQVIFYVACCSLKDSLSILTTLITILESE